MVCRKNLKIPICCAFHKWQILHVVRTFGNNSELFWARILIISWTDAFRLLYLFQSSLILWQPFRVTDLLLDGSVFPWMNRL